MKYLKKSKPKKRNYIQMQKDSELLIEAKNENKTNLTPFKAKSLKLSYQINTESKYENNNLQHQPKIIKPNLNSNTQHLSSINENEIFVFNNAKNKIIRSLSYFLTKSEKYYEYLRNYIYNILNNFRNVYLTNNFYYIFNNNI